MPSLAIDFLLPNWESAWNNDAPAMQIYVHRNNQQLGPFTEDEIKAQFNTNAISVNDHVWWQGQPGWTPLGSSPLAAVLIHGASAVPLSPPGVGNPQTSQLAIWSLVCGCLTLFCGIFTGIPAIVLGHLALSETKSHPNLQGRGMAWAGLIVGYLMTLLYVAVVVISILIALGSQVKGTFKTIDTQLKPAPESSDTDQSTNSSDQSTNDDSSSTNSADSSTNATPVITP